MDTLTYIFLLFTTIKNDMKTTPKIVNNLIIENIFPLKVSDNQFMSKHTFYIQNPFIDLFKLDILHLLIC